VVNTLQGHNLIPSKTLVIEDDHRYKSEAPIVSSQYRDGVYHFPWSDLSVFSYTFSRGQAGAGIYWGKIKPERQEKYDEYLKILDVLDPVPYDQLHNELKGYSFTAIFGDPDHNDNNKPLRVFEALSAGLIPFIDEELDPKYAFSNHKKSIFHIQNSYDIGVILKSISNKWLYHNACTVFLKNKESLMTHFESFLSDIYNDLILD